MVGCGLRWLREVEVRIGGEGFCGGSLVEGERGLSESASEDESSKSIGLAMRERLEISPAAPAPG